MSSIPTYDVVLIGGGFSGCALLLALARTLPDEQSIHLAGDGNLGSGTAYGDAPGLYMNGPVREMSAVADDACHLARFVPDAGPDALIERRRFGAYVGSVVGEARRSHSRCTTGNARIVDIVDRGTVHEITASNGQRFNARYVVLALGNFPPDAGIVPAAIRGDERVQHNPWRFDAGAVGSDVAVVGAGLTAMDVVAQLAARPHVRMIQVIARRQCFPYVERPSVRALDPLTLGLDVSTPQSLLRTLRIAAETHAASGGDWRAAVDSVRKLAPRIWSSWSLQERRRFLRHLEGRWSAYRYRVPERTAIAVAEAAASGRLVRHAGKLSAATADDRLRLTVESSAGARQVTADALINCTGPSIAWGLKTDPLLRTLRERGTIRADALSMGLDATPALRLRDASGTAHQRLFTLGPPARGTFYESTAVPEIRTQAAALARSLQQLLATTTVGAA